jgi:hypothetical protein
LSPKNYIVFNFCSTGNTTCPANKQFLPTSYHDHMYKVIDLCSCTDHRISAYSTINSAISTDLYKIFDHALPQLFIFYNEYPGCFFVIIKCIAANNVPACIITYCLSRNDPKW